MKLILCLCLCLTSSFAAKELYEDDQAADLQRDIQDYLRRLTQQQQIHSTHNMHPAPHHGMLPYPRLNVPHPVAMRGPPEVNRAFETDEEGPPVPPERFPFQIIPRGGAARSYASSSVTVKRPRLEDGSSDVMGAEAVAYSSVKDVDDEEHLGESAETSAKTTLKVSSNDDHSTKVTSKMVSDPMARKQDLSTQHQQDTETLVKDEGAFSDVYFVAIVAGCCAAGIFGIISAGFCFYRLQKSSKAAAEVDYPAYGVTGPNKDVSSPNGDRKLAQSAQMYHYQHQKQQMIAVEKAGSTKNTSASDVDSEEENEEGDYTVYECPGLAPTGEMEVKNPLFNDDSTPVSPPMLPSKGENNHNN